MKMTKIMIAALVALQALQGQQTTPPNQTAQPGCSAPGVPEKPSFWERMKDKANLTLTLPRVGKNVNLPPVTITGADIKRRAKPCPAPATNPAPVNTAAK